MPDVAEFPDGGRATLVRRHEPRLTSRELSILRHCPYDIPGTWKHPPRLAHELVKAGLLERHPDQPTVFRVTEAGAQVVQLWDAAGF